MCCHRKLSLINDWQFSDEQSGCWSRNSFYTCMFYHNQYNGIQRHSHLMTRGQSKSQHDFCLQWSILNGMHLSFYFCQMISSCFLGQFWMRWSSKKAWEHSMLAWLERLPLLPLYLQVLGGRSHSHPQKLGLDHSWLQWLVVVQPENKNQQVG